MKKDYLVVHDYGTGGLWAVIKARSKEEIYEKYFDLKVIENLPPWMTESQYRDIAASCTIDIDEPVTGWLANLAR